MKPTVNVVYIPGTNCQDETVRAFRRAGARPRLRFISEVVKGNARLDDADILCLPGGFAFGDHLGAGTVAGTLLSTQLHHQLAACRPRPMLCICNGFQIALRAGLFGLGVTLTTNDCGTFRNIPDQRHTVSTRASSIWLNGLSGATLVFPCAHGEGRFIYERRDGWQTALFYPHGSNPDGSMDDIAGITTRDGLVLGLMNHPERAIARDDNLAIFENGVRVAST